MYESHFGLDRPPFTLTPNTDFFVGLATHQEALNTLMLSVDNGEGFIKITGEVGTGKTLLCRTFLNRLDESGALSAYLPNPYVGPSTLLLGIADELGIARAARLNQHSLLKALTASLTEAHRAGRRVVLCLDEAQALPLETLEALRLVTNLETEQQKLVQVVLFGQPELDVRLGAPGIRQLRQRISFSDTLRPLKRAEVEHYVTSRLAIAGYRGAALFSARAITRIARASGGIPRLVNILANKAMLVAYGEGATAVGERHVRQAVHDTESIGRPLSRLRTRVAAWVLRA